MSDAPRRGITALRLALVLGVAAILLVLEQRALQRMPGNFTPPTWPVRLIVPGLLVGASLLIGEPLRWLVLGLPAAALSLLLLGDAACLDYYRQPLGAGMFRAAAQLWDARKSVSALVSPALFAIPLGCALLPLIGWLAFKRRRTGRERWVGVVLILAVSPWLGVLSPDQPGRPGVDYDAGRRSLSEAGLLSWHVRDVLEAGGKLLDRPTLAPDDEQRLLATLARKWELNQRSSPLFGLAAGRNVILVQLEAFQAFLLDVETPGGPATPVLRRLADQGLLYRAVDSTTIGRTSDAEFTVMTSLLPHADQPMALAHRGTRWTSLPSELAARGYVTATLHAFRRSFWNRAVVHLDYGIQELYFKERFGGGEQLGWGLADEDFFTRAPALLAELDQPVCALLISLSSHHPYDQVPAGLASWPTGLGQGMASNYVRLAHYTDGALDTLLSRLAELALLERSLIVVYGDHDAGLDAGARHKLGKRLGRDLDHPDSDRVPLLILVPGEEQSLAAYRARAQLTVAGMVDIAPTVLHLLGLPSPPGFWGTHLFVPPEQRDLVPLLRGEGFVHDGRLHATLMDRVDTATPEELAATQALARRALVELRTTEQILEHDGQQRIAALAAADPHQLATLAEASRGSEHQAPAVSASLPAWERTPSGPAEPLAAGRWLIPVVANRADGLVVQIDIEHPGAGADDGAWTLTGRDATGRPVSSRSGTLAGGARHTLDVEAQGDGGAGPVAWAELQLAPGLVARGWLRHRFGIEALPLIDRLQHTTHLVGPAEGTAHVAAMFINPTEEAADVQFTIRADGTPLAQERWPLPPGHASLRFVPIPEGTGQLEIDHQGAHVAFHCTRSNADRSAFR